MEKSGVRGLDSVSPSPSSQTASSREIWVPRKPGATEAPALHMSPTGNSAPVCLMKNTKSDLRENICLCTAIGQWSVLPPPPFLPNSSLFSQDDRSGATHLPSGSTFHKGALLFAALGEKACPGPSPVESSLSFSPSFPSSGSWFKPLPAPANNALSRSDRITVSHWFHMSQIIALLVHHIEVVRTLLRL